MKLIIMKIFSVICLLLTSLISVSESNTQDLLPDERQSLLFSFLCLQSEHLRKFCFNDNESRSDGPIEKFLRSLKNRRFGKSRSLEDELSKSELPIKRGGDNKDSGFYSNW